MADTPQRTDPNAPVLLVGLGRFGAATAEELVAQGREVLAVERDPVLVQRYAPSLTHVVEADATDSEALRQLGYTVTLLDPATDLTLDRLRSYDAVVLGIRAYNTVEKLKSQQAELLKYAEQGGTVVVQYVVTRGVLLPQIGPYPLTLSNNRITVASDHLFVGMETVSIQ